MCTGGVNFSKKLNLLPLLFTECADHGSGAAYPRRESPTPGVEGLRTDCASHGALLTRRRAAHHAGRVTRALGLDERSARLRCPLAQLVRQPPARETSLAVRRAGRHAQDLGRLLDRETGKEAHLDQLRLAQVEFGR